MQGWLYLACVTDVFSRLIIGWSMAEHMRTDLIADALTMATLNYNSPRARSFTPTAELKADSTGRRNTS